MNMIEEGRTYVVMGLLSPDSIAYRIGKTIEELGGHVIYTVQNELLKKRYLDSSPHLTDKERSALAIRFCDAGIEEEVRELFADLRDVAGVVHSIAYANPKTCLGEELHTDAIEDIKRSYEISCISLATVTRYAQPLMPDGGSIVALSFDTKHAFPYYNWMGVHKAALEALIRTLARHHGRDKIRINAVSAGPLRTAASSRIPGFEGLIEMWNRSSPIKWDPVEDKQAVANAVAFLLSPLAAKITGQILGVDGGASIVGGDLMDFEK